MVDIAREERDRPAEYEKHFFISFNEEFLEYAREIEAVLRGQGFSAWLQSYESRRGREIDPQIRDGIRKSAHFMALAGGRYETSAWTKAELEYFIEDRKRHDPASRKLFALDCEAVDPADPNLKATYRGRLYDKPTAEARRAEIIATILHEPAQQRAPLNAHFDNDMPEPAACVGREDRLEEITKHFFPGGEHDPVAARASPVPGSRRRVLIQAGPGFGKTTLAAQYARSRGKLFAGVWWFKADEPSGLLDRIIERIPGGGSRGDASEPPDSEDRLQHAEAVLKRRFGDTNGPFLLVFDNVTSSAAGSAGDEAAAGEGTEQLVLRLVKQLPANLRVLMTARRPDWDSVAHPIKLEALLVDVAAGFLRERTKRPKDVEGSLELADALGGLPLALDHAVAYCNSSQRSFKDYAADHAELIKEAPADAEYEGSVFATVTQALRQASKLGGDDAVRLADFVSYCAAEGIPRSLLDQALDARRRVDAAIRALQDVALLQSSAGYADGDPSTSVHRLVQNVIRVETDKQGRSPAVIARLMPFLCKQLVSVDASGEVVGPRNKDLQFRKYFPHLFQALPHLDAPDFRGHDDSDLLDNVAKLVVLALVEQAAASGDGGPAFPPYLPQLLGCFYELEPLSDPLDALLERIHRQPETRQATVRAKFCDGCLEQGNYVLRVALAEALARTVLSKTLEETEITTLIVQKRSLDHFELGGYALKAIYSARDSAAEMKTELLERLANHPCYPGRSILGDLMINLVYKGFEPSRLLPRGKGEKHPFWDPVWDFIAYDVNAIRAAELANANTPPGPGASEAVKEEHKFYLQMQAWRAELLDLLKPLPTAAGVYEIVERFFEIGAKQELISEQSDAFAKLSTPEPLVSVLRLLFAHPLWSVGETTAGVIAGLIRDAREKAQPDEAKAYRDAIRTLLASREPWRVPLAAMETAYQFRHEDEPEKMATFSDGIHRFYADPSSKLRGLCAENLFSVMLNASDNRRRELERQFKREIRFWLRDEDCWVLEHVHRYFHALHLRHLKVSRFIGGRVMRALGVRRGSRLFAGLNGWWKADREKFLTYIDREKGKVSNRGRKVKRPIPKPRFWQPSPISAGR